MVARENFQEILRHTFDIELRTRLLRIFSLFFSFSFFINDISIDETWRRRNFTRITWWLIIDHSMNESTHEPLSSSTLFIIMIVNRKDDIDPSDIRFERMDPSITWKRVLYIYRLFCRSWTLSKLSSRGIEDGWPVIDDEAWLVAAEIEGVFIETPFLGRGYTGWIFIHGFLISRIGDKIVSPSITDNTSLSLLSYKLLFIINPINYRILYFLLTKSNCQTVITFILQIVIHYYDINSRCQKHQLY